MTSRGTREPLGENLRPADDRKAPRFAETLRRQFRQVVKHLTGKSPAPAPKPRRRRTEDTGRAAFRMAAMKIMRRASRLPVFSHAVSMWDTLAWLHLWDWNDPAGTHEAYDDFHRTGQHHLSPHL